VHSIRIAIQSSPQKGTRSEAYPTKASHNINNCSPNKSQSNQSPSCEPQSRYFIPTQHQEPTVSTKPMQKLTSVSHQTTTRSTYVHNMQVDLILWQQHHLLQLRQTNSSASNHCSSLVKQMIPVYCQGANCIFNRIY